MSKDESLLSNMSTPGVSGGTQAHLVKVLANVVETQKSVASQFSALFDRVEESRNETRRNVAALADEIKKLEIRSSTMFEKVTTQLMAQNEALSAAHAAERAQLISQNDNILNILKTTIASTPRPAPVQPQPMPQMQPMQAYGQAMSANAMFGGLPNQEQQLIDQFNQLTPAQVAALQNQMRQLQQLQAQQQQQAILAARAAASSTTIATPAAMPSVPTVSVPAVPAAATPAPAAPVVATQPAAPKVEVKPVEVKPVVPTPAPAAAAAPKPLFSFGSPSLAGSTAPKPVFGGSMAPSSTTASAAPFSFVAPKPAPKAEIKEEAADDENDDDHVEEYEPDVQFTPVIPLPDMVETVTGEESEKVLFEERCKLFRFTNGEWKERATGSMKVLKNEKTGKHRVVVRRDQVHKVAANFYLAAGVKITPMKANPKAVVWFCRDFSENEQSGEDEQLSAKFASPQQAEEFMTLANKIVDAAPKTAATPNKVEETKKTETVGAKVEIPKAEEPKKAAAVVPTAAAPTAAWGDKFKMVAGEWECSGCYVRNAADASQCSCCGEANPNSEKKESDKPSNVFGKNATVFNPTTAAAGTGPKFSFGIGGGSAAASPATTTPAAAPKTETKPAATAATFSFGSASAAAPAAPTFGAAVTTTAGAKLSFLQAAAAATKEDEKPKPLFGSSAAPSPASNAFGGGVTPTPTASTFSFKPAAAATASPMPAFSFKTPDPSKPASIFGGSQKTLFGTSSPATPFDAGKKPEEEKKETPGSVFGSSFMNAGGQSTSAGFGGLSGKPSIFEQQDKVAEGQKNFANLAKSKPFGQSAAVAAAAPAKDEEGGEEGDPEEYEPDVQFAPVIPLPDLVEVKTGEENEKVLFTARSKIFRYVRETKEYKERGVGDLKLLHNEDTNKFRVVMRRDQVHKLCANFSVLKTSNLIVKEGQDNVRSIVVTDFAENDAGDMESLCIKFKNADIAKDFHQAFSDAQARLQ